MSSPQHDLSSGRPPSGAKGAEGTPSEAKVSQHDLSSPPVSSHPMAGVLTLLARHWLLRLKEVSPSTKASGGFGSSSSSYYGQPRYTQIEHGRVLSFRESTLCAEAMLFGNALDAGEVFLWRDFEAWRDALSNEKLDAIAEDLCGLAVGVASTFLISKKNVLQRQTGPRAVLAPHNAEELCSGIFLREASRCALLTLLLAQRRDGEFVDWEPFSGWRLDAGLAMAGLSAGEYVEQLRDQRSGQTSGGDSLHNSPFSPRAIFLGPHSQLFNYMGRPAVPDRSASREAWLNYVVPDLWRMPLILALEEDMISTEEDLALWFEWLRGERRAVPINRDMSLTLLTSRWVPEILQRTTSITLFPTHADVTWRNSGMPEAAFEFRLGISRGWVPAAERADNGQGPWRPRMAAGGGGFGGGGAVGAITVGTNLCLQVAAVAIASRLGEAAAGWKARERADASEASSDAGRGDTERSEGVCTASLSAVHLSMPDPRTVAQMLRLPPSVETLRIETEGRQEYGGGLRMGVAAMCAALMSPAFDNVAVLHCGLIRRKEAFVEAVNAARAERAKLLGEALTQGLSGRLPMHFHSIRARLVRFLGPATFVSPD